jgi:hypothetical protein
MKKRKKIWFASLRKFLPLLYFHISIPFLELRTSLLTQRWETCEFDYISLQWKIWKWRGDIALYTTRQRIIENGNDW